MKRTGGKEDITRWLTALGPLAEAKGQVVLASRPRHLGGGMYRVLASIVPEATARQHTTAVARRTPTSVARPAKKTATTVQRPRYVRKKWTKKTKLIVASVAGTLVVAVALLVVTFWAYLSLIAACAAVGTCLVVKPLRRVLFGVLSIPFAILSLLTSGSFCPGCLCGTCKGH